MKVIKQKDRKKIIMLADDIRMHSGVAGMAREIVMGTAHKYNWFNIGAAINHPEVGKILDISADVNKQLDLTDAWVRILPSNGYGDPMLLRNVIKQEKPDALFIFTDPRYWVWLFDMEREIRTKIPIFWYNIWDDYPSPLYNVNYYDSVDTLMAISKQTKNINELVLGDKAKTKLTKYIPHGINEKFFFPIEDKNKLKELADFKKDLYKGKDIEFTVFFNSRNIHRKHPGDTILAFRHFCDMIGKEKAKKCALIMHTAVVDQNGTDLRAVKEALCDPDYVNVYFSSDRLTPEQMNLLYNVADVNVLMSSNEGWGLSLTEAMITGTMIIPNVTGGMQDQCRFENEKGEWIDFDADFPSNHRGTYTKCGDWAVPVFPSNISLAGSPPTPYIFDDRANPEDVANAIKTVYELGPDERKKRGLKGREWALSEEAGFTAKVMADRVGKTIEEGFKKFKPRPKFEIIKAGKIPSKYVKHKILNY